MPRGLLTPEHETAGARAGEIYEAGSDKLAASSLRIDQGFYRLGKVCRLCGPVGVVGVPGLKQLDNATTMRIIGFNGFDPFDGIATAKRKKGIAAPGAPLLEAAERPAGFESRGVLATPAPDGQRRGE
jgi:hypothetical protein